MEKDLTKTQLAIMKCIWDHHTDISYQELMEVLTIRFNRDYQRSTMVTFLQQLVGRGYVETYRIRKFAYVHPVVSEEEYRIRLARTDTDLWFHGRAAEYLAALMKTGKLEEDDREEIRRLLDET